MNLLGFDTSSPALTVACLNRDGLLAEANFEGPLRHSENLFRLIQSALENVNLSIPEIEAYVIGMGPGSFTGLRIGFSVLKGFLTVNPKPVYGVSSLELTAWGVPIGSGRLAVAVNARRGRIYTVFYRIDKDRFERESEEDELLNPEMFLRRCEGHEVVVGDAIEEYGEKIRSAHPEILFMRKEFWYPRAGHLVRFAASRYKNMKPLDQGALKPRYLRLSEAEEKVLGDLHTRRPST